MQKIINLMKQIIKKIFIVIMFFVALLIYGSIPENMQHITLGVIIGIPVLFIITLLTISHVEFKKLVKQNLKNISYKHPQFYIDKKANKVVAYCAPKKGDSSENRVKDVSDITEMKIGFKKTKNTKGQEILLMSTQIIFDDCIYSTNSLEATHLLSEIASLKKDILITNLK